MSDTITDNNLVIVQGDDVDLVIGPVELPDALTGVKAPLDLTVASVKLWLTAKQRYADADAAAEIQLGTASAALTGITPDAPATASKNYATAHILGAMTADLEAPIDLRYDVQLEESSGRTTTLQRGTLRVLPEATKA